MVNYIQLSKYKTHTINDLLNDHEIYFFSYRTSYFLVKKQQNCQVQGAGKLESSATARMSAIESLKWFDKRVCKECLQ